MNTSQKNFMLVAEELCISNASQKAYVSPQSMSAHIKRLEQDYGVRLFTRKPRMSLTPEGQILYDSLKKIQLMEADVTKQLENIGKGLTGTVKFGIDTSRGKMLLQETYAQFHERYPDISFEMTNGFTPDLLPQILDGSIHFMLGTYWDNFPELAVILLQQEHYCYVVSDRVLKKIYGTDWGEKKKQFIDTGVHMQDVVDIPLILTTKASYMHQQLTRLFQEHAVFPKVRFQSNIHSTNIEMAASGFGACFCPSMLAGTLLPSAANYLGEKSDLYAYSIRDFEESHSISIVFRKDIYLPPYVQTAINYFVEKYRR